MAAPATDWTLIRITGHLRDWSANELTGTITFTPNVEHAESDATNMMVVPSTLTGTFVAGIMKDAALNSYMDIPATNDPDIQPSSGWTYRMVIATALKTISWDVSVPYDAAGGTLDLTDLTPVAPAPPVTGAGGATQWTAGDGSPEGVVIGSIGDIWSRTDGAAGTTLYTKQSGTGNTGWAPLVPNGRQITAGSGLTGGGDFSSDRTLAASYGTPGSSAVGDTAAAGTATTVPHSDHRHAREGFGAVTAAAIGAASANGTATTVAHSDHNHGLPASAVADVTGLTAALAAKAPLASPALTGTPTAPTATANTNTTQIATTAYADTAAGAAVTYGTPGSSAVADTVVAGAATTVARSDHRHGREAFGAVTANTGYNTSSANGTATTVSHSDHNHGLPAIAESDVTSLTSDLALKAPLASPALTGTPTAPTAAPGTNTTQVASTAYVTAADVAERTATATLTGKTLTSPVVNTPTGIVKGDVGLGSVDNTSDAGKPVSTAQQTALNLKTDKTTTVTAGTGLTGGGDLSANRTLTVAYGQAASTAVQGNDYRLSGVPLGELLTSGEVSIPRRIVQAMAAAQASGTLTLAYFTAQRTETINNLAMICAGTAAASLTLCRLAVYSVAGNGDLTLVASTVSDTALFAATSTRYQKALSSAWSKTAGQMYAVGHLAIGTTMPVLYGDNSQGGFVVSTLRGIDPRLTGSVASQTDLLSTYTAASVGVSRSAGYTEMLP